MESWEHLLLLEPTLFAWINLAGKIDSHFTCDVIHSKKLAPLLRHKGLKLGASPAAKITTWGLIRGPQKPENAPRGLETSGLVCKWANPRILYGLSEGVSSLVICEVAKRALCTTNAREGSKMVSSWFFSIKSWRGLSINKKKTSWLGKFTFLFSRGKRMHACQWHFKGT